MNESIKAIEKEIWELERKLEELRAANSSYFVVWYEVGYPDNYYRYYVPIPRTTEDRVISRIDEYRCDEDTLDSGYKEISEHEYNLYLEWAALEDIVAGFTKLKYVTKKEQFNELVETLNARILTIKGGLGLKWNWERVSRRG